MILVWVNSDTTYGTRSFFKCWWFNVNNGSKSTECFNEENSFGINIYYIVYYYALVGIRI